MVEDEFADFGRAGCIEVDSGNNRTVVRNEEIAVYRNKCADNYGRRNTQFDGDWEQRRHCRALAVDQYRQNKQGKGKGPWCRLNQMADGRFHFC